MDAAGEYARLVSAEVRSQMGIRRVSGLWLAGTCDFSQNYLSKRLRDELPFTLNDVEEIADAMGLDYLTLVIPPSRRFDDKRGA